MRRSVTLVLVSLSWLCVTGLALPNEISYEIQARLDTQEHKLYGTERILFTNKAEKPLRELYLHLWPNRFAEGGVKRRSKVMLTHLRGVDKRRITDVYGHVSEETMWRVEDALKIATGLVEF